MLVRRRPRAGCLSPPWSWFAGAAGSAPTASVRAAWRAGEAECASSDSSRLLSAARGVAVRDADCGRGRATRPRVVRAAPVGCSLPERLRRGPRGAASRPGPASLEHPLEVRAGDAHPPGGPRIAGRSPWSIHYLDFGVMRTSYHRSLLAQGICCRKVRIIRAPLGRLWPSSRGLSRRIWISAERHSCPGPLQGLDRAHAGEPTTASAARSLWPASRNHFDVLVET